MMAVKLWISTERVFLCEQGQALGNNAQEQLYQALSTINADLTSANPVGAVVQTAARAMPPAIVGR